MGSPTSHTKARLIFWIAREFHHVGGLKADQSLQWARETLKEYEDDLGVRVGHPDYDWSPSVAAVIAREMALQYWEPVL